MHCFSKHTSHHIKHEQNEPSDQLVIPEQCLT